MRVVTVQHFGCGDTYTFLCDYEVKPGEILMANAKDTAQYVRALTSDYEVMEQDAKKLFGVMPYKKVIGKVMNTCYCNGTCAQTVPVAIEGSKE